MNVGCAKLLTFVFGRISHFFKITLLVIGKEDTWLLFIDQKSFNWSMQGNWQRGKLLSLFRLKAE